MRAFLRVIFAVLASSLVCFFADVYAESLNLTVTDQSGKPVDNAVVSAYSQSKQNHLPVSPKKIVIVDQIEKEFVDHVTPIQVGTAVNFPNHDQIRHHVYSFSPAKIFELPLYKGVPDQPVVFEQAGVVALGCNIHDWMSAYIVVIDSPYFAITDEHGRTSLTLPVGDYEIRTWHRDADQQTKSSKQTIKMMAGQTGNITFQLSVKPSWSSRRTPVSINNRGRYR